LARARSGSRRIALVTEVNCQNPGLSFPANNCDDQRKGSLGVQLLIDDDDSQRGIGRTHGGKGGKLVRSGRDGGDARIAEDGIAAIVIAIQLHGGKSEAVGVGSGPTRGEVEAFPGQRCRKHLPGLWRR